MKINTDCGFKTALQARCLLRHSAGISVTNNFCFENITKLYYYKYVKIFLYNYIINNIIIIDNIKSHMRNITFQCTIYQTMVIIK